MLSLQQFFSHKLLTMNPLHFFSNKSLLFIFFGGILSLPLISQNCAGVDFTYKIIDNTIVFIGESKKEVTEWTWSFGDNTVEDGRVVKHKYEKSGEYEVCLKFYSSRECSGVVCKKIKFDPSVNECGLSADFSFKMDGKTVILNGTSNDGLAKYLWSVSGYNSQYIGKEVKIPFEKDGTYEVCLIVVNKEDNCKIQICKKIEIGAICRIDLDFNYETSGNIIKLQGRTNAGENAKFVWSFGNGATGEGKNIRYKYEKPGVYEICLKIISEDPTNPKESCTKTICKKITIKGNITECDIKADFSVKTDGLTALFTGTSSEQDAKYTWYINGLSGQYSGKDVKIPFLKEGVYEVCLIVVNRAETCKVQVCKKVEIKLLSDH